ncbi:hypothetical protein [Microbulbifer sp.]|uniref:hypothetical protein n=1 Tax=Microbulbifer sp. TaxID=1908541 RepID=UPI003F2CDCD4
MAVMRYSSLVLAGLAIFWGAEVAAQSQASLSAEKNRLARMEQSMENHMVEIEDIENELVSYEYKLKRAKESLADARKKHEESRRELQQAERDHQLNKSSDSERQLNKAQHGFSMAERGVDSRSRRVEFIQSNYDDLNDQLKVARQAVARSESRIAEQRIKVEQVHNAVLAKADAEKRAAAMARKAAPVKPEVPPPSVAEVKMEPEPEPEEEMAEEPQREVDAELVEYVRREMGRLDKLLADNDRGRRTFRDLELDPSHGDSLSFEFLGHNQYRLVAPVEAGRQVYKIKTWKFRRTIPSDDDGERYVFIFDGRRLSRPRLVMYPEYVLSHLD